MTVLNAEAAFETATRAEKVLIADPLLAVCFRAQREASGTNSYDEVWDGVYVVSPFPNNAHRRLATRLCSALVGLIEQPGDGIVCGSMNVSDREEDWVHNFRVPDAGVFLPGNPARDWETHWLGGPDFAVEILSKGDLAREKLPFYAGVGVREVLIVDRDPWALELYRLDDCRLAPAGMTDLETPDVLTSHVLPLSFRLVPGRDRPQIEMTRNDGAGRWLV